ncbi:DEAD-box type RNA helicase [Orbilia blumenaviensis]|uniref:DEAD-box type RNA helicase n=1 Tax=Orbilia blumenaviensis TaxID=1796055 RepID=A0AAV9TVV8_9PEZI
MVVKAVLASASYNRIIVCAEQNTALERIFEFVMDVLDATTTKVLYLQGRKLERSKNSRLRDLDIIFATLDMIQRELESTMFPANFVLLDEAASTSELDTLIPITKFNKTLARLVLVGDPLQLQPFSPATDPITRCSLFLHCQISGWPIARLIDNYRMHTKAAAPIRNIFYNSDSMMFWGLMRHSNTNTFYFQSTDSAKLMA